MQAWKYTCQQHLKERQERSVTEMKDCENESNRARTIGGMEVCAGQMPEGQEESEGRDVDHRNVPGHIHRMPF